MTNYIRIIKIKETSENPLKAKTEWFIRDVDILSMPLRPNQWFLLFSALTR